MRTYLYDISIENARAKDRTFCLPMDLPELHQLLTAASSSSCTARKLCSLLLTSFLCPCPHFSLKKLHVKQVPGLRA